ncbi:probable tRNA (guanine(26)-N(2))-dimethyltransferase isoform X2 [Aricia agestis]|nr:probable tRNA (guanine(26)-N(2))-dimethyltransferase isoform X2 [Aricia agestis]
MKMEVTKAEHSTKSIIEGQAEIRLSSEKVFYNPVQEFNRDLSIAVLSVFIQDFKEERLKKKEKRDSKGEDTSPIVEAPITILEALSATGLRSIRYAKEVQQVDKIIANDLSEQAVQTIKENIEYNGIEHLVETSHDDACMVMYKHKHHQKRFTAIDLDPYGCPAIFLDSAVQSVQDGGLLLVTATDMAILAGNTPETCYYKYGAVSLKAKFCHEMALRILLQSIEHHANRYSRYIEPVLSVSVDFYIRVFVRVRTGAIHCKKTTSKLSMVYHCTGCDNFVLHPLGGFKPNPTEKNPAQTKSFLPTVSVGDHCSNCNQKYHLGGPIWSAPIHNADFVSRLSAHVETHAARFGTARRLLGVLSMVGEELEDVPLYHVLDKLCGRVHVQPMPMMIMRSALLHGGYRVSYSHASRQSLKTDAPAQFVWDAVRAWARAHPVKPDHLQRDPVAAHILTRATAHAVRLEARADADPASRRAGALRFQFNPAPHWGPGSRANVNIGENNCKAIKNQNKNQSKRKRQDTPSSQEDNAAKKSSN